MMCLVFFGWRIFYLELRVSDLFYVSFDATNCYQEFCW